MVNTDYAHLALSSQCGICTGTIATGKLAIALFGGVVSTAFGGITHPFPLPHLGSGISVGGTFFLCRRLGCPWCARSLETVSLHMSCLEIFQAQCSVKRPDPLCRLWVAAAWRNPWRGALPLRFPLDAVRSSSLEAFCRIFKLPPLHKLPLEILRMIQGYSSDHVLLWRVALAIDLAAQISNQPPSSLSTIPLRNIFFWVRGGQPQVMSSPFPPLIRITVDSTGISKIERISCQPYTGDCSISHAYVVVHEQAISKCIAQFKHGFVRLKLASSSPPAIWNTPNPPNLLFCQAYEISRASNQRFSAVELDRITGITFFFSSHKLRGVHAHRPGALYALSPSQRLVRQQRDALWCYLPLGDKDRILVLGVRTSSSQHINILVRMERAGDVILGQYISSPTEDRCLGWHAPITLIHGEPHQEGEPVPYFGAYCKQPPGSEFPKRLQVPEPKSTRLAGSLICHFW